MPENFNYGTDKLTPDKTIQLLSGKLKGVLSDAAIKKIKT